MNVDLSPHVHLKNERISDDDAARQTATAHEICRRFKDQPGLILADEVGMGKTFVAFAVAVSVLHATGRRRPVVVMVPPAVAEKWPRDWSHFREACLSGGPEIRASDHTITKGSEFLKLLDDPAERRTHLIFLKHGALSTALSDPFIELAIIRQAFRHQRRLVSQRNAFPRWAARVLNNRAFTEERVRVLLDSVPSTWRTRWDRMGGPPLTDDDDPVPAAAIQGIDAVDLGDVRATLAAVPLRESAYLGDRLQELRTSLTHAVQRVWLEALRGLNERLPLLILDEAHHLRNPTSLSRLFDSPEAERDADVVSASGPLADTFHRMLFLTATPFQLGHRELINVLRRFNGARIPAAEKQTLRTDLDALALSLDRAQAQSLRLEQAWSRLTVADVRDLPDGWWNNCPADATDAIRTAVERVQATAEALKETGTALRPWVIRHVKERRREYRAGAQIVDPGDGPTGIEVGGTSILPFLLATRAQALMGLHGMRDRRATRVFFADGLASSFEAFAETRRERDMDRDETVDDLAQQSIPSDVQWYLDEIAEALPDADAASWSTHPKVQATVREAARLWCRGEKVLIFCFYRATGRALRSHISRAVQTEIERMGAGRLGLETGDEADVMAALERRGTGLLRAGSAAAELVRARVQSICHAQGVAGDDCDQTVEVVLRFMRTASFLARFVDLRRDGARAIESVLNEAGPAVTPFELQISAFAAYVQGLTAEERAGLWDALRGVQTGSITTVAADHYDPGERSSTRESVLPNVRLANGTVRQETRQRLMRTFNTPFFPEILIASSVMAEGVDLHLECRHVIHHDLDWNPSVLEQRTGRVDRIGSKAERDGKDIIVCEPYLAGAQDEKVYRVVKDRERWFNVVLSEKFDSSDGATDRLADRLPLIDEVAQDLSIDLAVWRGTD